MVRIPFDILIMNLLAKYINIIREGDNMEHAERLKICKDVIKHIIEVQDKGYADDTLVELVDTIDDKFAECLSKGEYRYDAYAYRNDKDVKTIYLCDGDDIDFESLFKSHTVIEVEFDLNIDFITDETGAIMSILDTNNLEVAVEDALNDRYEMEDKGGFKLDINMDGDTLHIGISIIMDED
jgi:hypothetical protein